MQGKKLPLKVFKYVYSKVPRLCVDLVLKNSKGVLLSKRDIPPDKGWWHFPGGTVLFGETLKETAQRVAMEELNVKIKIVKLYGFLEYRKNGLGYAISALFAIKPLTDKLEGGEQARQIGYFKRVPEKTLPDVKRFLKEKLDLK